MLHNWYEAPAASLHCEGGAYKPRPTESVGVTPQPTTAIQPRSQILLANLGHLAVAKKSDKVIILSSLFYYNCNASMGIGYMYSQIKWRGLKNFLGFRPQAPLIPSRASLLLAHGNVTPCQAHV